MCSCYSNDGANNAFANRFEIPLNSDFHKHILQVKMVQILPIENARPEFRKNLAYRLDLRILVMLFASAGLYAQ